MFALKVLQVATANLNKAQAKVEELCVHLAALEQTVEKADTLTRVRFSGNLESVLQENLRVAALVSFCTGVSAIRHVFVKGLFCRLVCGRTLL